MKAKKMIVPILMGVLMAFAILPMTAAPGDAAETGDTKAATDHTQKDVSVSTRLKAWMQLPGGDFEIGDFYYLLFDYTPGSYYFGLPILDALNDSKGRIVFEDGAGTAPERRKLYYTENDIGKTFVYVAKQLPGNDPNIEYTDKVVGFEVTVEDNENGTLEVTVQNVAVLGEDGTYASGGITSEPPVFVNHLKSGNLELTKLTSWDTSGSEPAGNTKFSFKLTFAETEGVEIPSEITVWKEEGVSGQQAYSSGNEPAALTADEKAEQTMAPDDEHSISFTLKAGQKLCVKDLPCGLAYQFQEELPPGWTPAFENAGGTIAAQSTASACCSNRYEPGKAVATIAVAKKMNGQTPEAGQFVFELVDDNEDSPTYKETLQTLLNQPSGNVVFYPVFTEAGTYHYIIREVQNRLVDYVDRDGNIVYADSDSAQTQEKLRKIIFDPTKYHVKVDVKEKEHGGETTLSTAVTCDEGEVVFTVLTKATSICMQCIGID